MTSNDTVDVKVNATVEVTAITADAGIKAELDGSDFEGTVLQVRAEGEFFGVRYTDPDGVEHVVQGPGQEWAEATYQRFASTGSSPAVVRSRVLYLDWEVVS
ncbi:hypothetical protein SEA_TROGGLEHUMPER_20 [Rhodococcus phage Trogglehumper]|uniref:Uncharacterized protein n=1 Tax=Rhodococcus phage Trogglehumper TaxID=3038381 RepID=A0AAF0GLC4_9CAUD|nr:hypothetical protein SEA_TROGGLEHUMPER_20 [Rhodococcus phage Trogglehumper]